MTLLAGSGCTPVVVGGGAAGGYAVATDQRSAGRQVDDVTITTRVKAGMVQDATVKARDIDVDTVSGVVYLTGYVDSARERERAESIARSVSGVAAVQNNLQVGSRSVGQALDDKNLGVKIKAKLIGEPGIRSLAVDVDVYRGVVHLTGTVESAAQKTKILELTRSTPGTVRIVDNIRVKGH
ncbi:MAG: BON domain-containing protein [Thermodesulfobacteriota bacterium]